MAKIILGILVLGGAAFFIFSGDKKEESPSEEVISEENSSVSETKKVEEDFNEKTTLAKLMEKGGNYQCTFTHKTEVGDSTGTVFMSGKKIRGDFVSKVSMEGLGNMGDIKTYMISDGESVYTWSSMTADGYKAPVTQTTEKETQASVPTNQELDYKCAVWKADESKFSLPTNIIFKTI